MAPTVLVLGAGGTVGAGIVSALLGAGIQVIGADSDESRLEQLRACNGVDPRLQLMQTSVADDADAAAFASRLRERRQPLAAVVASLASPLQPGRLLGQPTQFLRDKLDADLMPHLAAARHLLPLLCESEHSTDYVMIGGPGAEQAWSGYGHASVAAAAMQMLARVLHDEAQTLGVRVQLLAVDRPIATDTNQSCACPEWTSALAIGGRVVQLLQRNAPPRPIVPYVPAATPNAPNSLRTHYEVF